MVNRGTEKGGNFSIWEDREAEREGEVGNEDIHKTHIESRSDWEVPAAIDEVSEDQCGKQKQRQVTFQSNVCSEKERSHWNPRTFFTKSYMHGPSQGQALLQTGFQRQTRSGRPGPNSEEAPVQMVQKCPVLPQSGPEDQAQVVPTSLAQVGLVLQSGFPKKNRKSRRLLEVWTKNGE